ncbi:MAG: hypothetical protein HYZ53_07575 [Planctomycetes bacterium]|nr:hypothetical protein [Planctomycetota bacterium]
MAAIERTVRAFHASLHGEAATFEELFASLSVYSREDLRRPCPASAAPKCWTPALDLPIWDRAAPVRAAAASEAPADLPPTALSEALRRELAEAGLELLDLRTALCCPGVLNERLGSGTYPTKFALEFAMIEDLLAWVHPRVGEEVDYVCGRLGGTRDAYPRMFGALSRFPCTAWDCGPRRTRYRFAGLGQVTFEESAEDAHLPVALASMVGKYVREGFVRRENLFFTGLVPGLRPTSGYCNGVTEAFVRGTEEVRRDLGIPDGCFLRRR